jgi:hypothetical protein
METDGLGMEQRQQMEIDFSRRGYQLRLLDQLRLPNVPGCSSGVLKQVLTVVDSFARESGWCFASLRTMAEQSNRNERTLRRALDVLVSMYLIRKQVKRGRSGNLECRYQPCWANIDAFIEQQSNESQIAAAADEWIDVEPTDIWEGGNGHETGGQRTFGGGATDMVSTGQRTRCPGVTDMVSGGNGQGVHLTAILSANEPPPLKEAAAVLETSIAEVEAILATRLYRGTARRLAHLCDEATARDIIVEYDDALARGHLKSPGAIAARIETGQWPQDCVRTAAEIRAAKEATERRIATERAAQAARDREREQIRTVTSDLEQRYGPVLDAMPPEELDTLARETLGDFLFGRWQGGKSMAVCREQLLAAIGGQYA